MKKNFFLCAITVLLSTTFISCEFDDSNLWNSIDDLENRVTSIEETLAGLNSDISDMKTIVNTLSKGAVITSCEETTTGYKLTFSDGKTIEIKHGKDGLNGEDAPVIGVKEDVDRIYYWTITINGITEWLLDNNGNKIRVTGEDGADGKDGIDGQPGEDGADGKDGIDGQPGEDGADGKDGIDGQPGKDGADGKDGITPIIGVDAEGYWTIDLGNGPERIKDANGNYVRAIGVSGDSFFTNVVVGEDEVVFYLASGESFSVYRVDNFGIEIDASETEIAIGESKEFPLTLTKVKTLFIASVSTDWAAEIIDDNLCVTAPSTLTEKNKEGEINLIATNKRGDCRAFTLVCTAVEKIAILTFEDTDAMFESYSLDYAGVTIEKWSDLIDDTQYGGALTYDMSGGTYSWNDANNTWLSHSFTTPFWSGGHAISNYVIADYSTLPEGHYGWYELQFSIPISGHNNSQNFCVHNGYVDDFNSSLGYGAYCPAITFSDGVERIVDHMYVTNTCYVLNSLTYGDGFCTPATDTSYYKIIAYGFDKSGNMTGQTEFYLCKGLDLVTTWKKFDLSILGKVASIQFNLDASEDFKGSYGLNAPAYFAYDDIAVKM